MTTTLSSRVGRLNPAWNEQQTPQDYDVAHTTLSHQQAQFAKAVAMTGQEFLAALSGLKDQWLPARSIVEEAMQGRFQVSFCL